MSNPEEQTRDACGPDKWPILETRINELIAKYDKDGLLDSHGKIVSNDILKDPDLPRVFLDDDDMRDALKCTIAQMCMKYRISQGHTVADSRLESDAKGHAPINTAIVFASAVNCAFEVLKDRTIELKNFNHVLDKLKEQCASMGNTPDDKSLLQAIEKVAGQILEGDDIGSVQLIVEYIKFKRRIAHIRGAGKDKEHHCAIWLEDMHRWSDESGNEIMKEIKKLKFAEDIGFKPTKRNINEAEASLAADEQTLQVDLTDDKYLEWRNSIRIDNSGKYWSMKDKKVYDIDPSIHYFANIDLGYELNEEAGEPKTTLEFHKERFKGNNSTYVIHHKAGAFVNADYLGDRPKMLELIGPTKAGKNIMMEEFDDLLADEASTNISTHAMVKDNFADGSLANKLYNWFDENTMAGHDKPEQQAKLKSLITKQRGDARIMYSQKRTKSRQWPRHIISVNKVMEISEDDEDESIYNRIMHVEINPPKDEAEMKKARAAILLDTEERVRWLMYLLRLASDIHNGKTTLQTQHESTSKEVYERLREGGLIQFLRAECVKATEIEGIVWSDLKQRLSNATGSHISNEAFRGMIAMIPSIDIRKKVRCTAIANDNYQIDTSSETQKTLILGITWKEKQTTLSSSIWE